MNKERTSPIPVHTHTAPQAILPRLRHGNVHLFHGSTMIRALPCPILARSSFKSLATGSNLAQQCFFRTHTHTSLSTTIFSETRQERSTTRPRRKSSLYNHHPPICCMHEVVCEGRAIVCLYRSTGVASKSMSSWVVADCCCAWRRCCQCVASEVASKKRQKRIVPSSPPAMDA